MDLIHPVTSVEVMITLPIIHVKCEVFFAIIILPVDKRLPASLHLLAQVVAYRTSGRWGNKYIRTSKLVVTIIKLILHLLKLF